MITFDLDFVIGNIFTIGRVKTRGDKGVISVDILTR